MITGGRGQVESDVQLRPDRLLGRRSSDGKLHSTGRCWSVSDQHGRDEDEMQEIVQLLSLHQWIDNDHLHCNTNVVGVSQSAGGVLINQF